MLYVTNICDRANMMGGGEVLGANTAGWWGGAKHCQVDQRPALNINTASCSRAQTGDSGKILSDQPPIGKVGLLKIFSSAIFFTSTEEAPSSAPASEASRRINDGSEEKCKLEQQCIREVGGKKDNFFASATENRSSSFWTHGSSSHFDGIRMHTQSLSCTSQSYFCHYSDVKSRVCIRAAVVLSCSCLPLR